MQNANITVCKYKFKTIMASCQTIWKGRVAWNLLLYLQMQQYLQELTQCCITSTRQGKDYLKQDWRILSTQNTAFKNSQRKLQRGRRSFKVSVPLTFLNSPMLPTSPMNQSKGQIIRILKFASGLMSKTLTLIS